MDVVKRTLQDLWKSNRPEVVLVGLSALIMLVSISFFLFVAMRGAGQDVEFVGADDEVATAGGTLDSSKKIFVDISGAVADPDLYEVPAGSRLKDVLVEAGGLAATADREFFARNFNLARVLKDQEKIYIPTKLEVREAGETGGAVGAGGVLGASQQNLININAASKSELESLPGIGPVTADKIISGRPFGSVDELLSKKAVNKRQYEKIKDKVTVN